MNLALSSGLRNGLTYCDMKRPDGSACENFGVHREALHDSRFPVEVRLCDAHLPVHIENDTCISDGCEDRAVSFRRCPAHLERKMALSTLPRVAPPFTPIATAEQVQDVPPPRRCEKIHPDAWAMLRALAYEPCDKLTEFAQKHTGKPRYRGSYFVQVLMDWGFVTRHYWLPESFREQLAIRLSDAGEQAIRDAIKAAKRPVSHRPVPKGREERPADDDSTSRPPRQNKTAEELYGDILEAIRKNPGIYSRQLSAMLDRSPSSIDLAAVALQRAGLVERRRMNRPPDQRIVISLYPAGHPAEAEAEAAPVEAGEAAPAAEAVAPAAPIVEEAPAPESSAPAMTAAEQKYANALALIRQTPGLTTRQIRTTLDWPQSSTAVAVLALEDAGLIERRREARPTDHRLLVRLYPVPVVEAKAAEAAPVVPDPPPPPVPPEPAPVAPPPVVIPLALYRICEEFGIDPSQPLETLCGELEADIALRETRYTEGYERARDEGRRAEVEKTRAMREERDAVQREYDDMKKRCDRLIGAMNEGLAEREEREAREAATPPDEMDRSELRTYNVGEERVKLVRIVRRVEAVGAAWKDGGVWRWEITPALSGVAPGKDNAVTLLRVAADL